MTHFKFSNRVCAWRVRGNFSREHTFSSSVTISVRNPRSNRRLLVSDLDVNGASVVVSTIRGGRHRRRWIACKPNLPPIDHFGQAHRRLGPLDGNSTEAEAGSER